MKTVLKSLYGYVLFLPWALLWTLVCLLILLLGCIVSRRFTVQRVAKVWGRVLCGAIPLEVNFNGLSNIDPRQSYIVVANHGSQLDIPLIAGWLPMDLRWVAKQELKRHPIIGTASRIMGNIFIDRRNTEAAIASLQTAGSLLVNGTSLLFFPEGTRGEGGKTQPFKKGAFVTAKTLSLPILMVSIANADSAMPKGRLIPRAAAIDIIIHAPIAAPDVDRLDAVSLLEQCQTTVLSSLNQGA